MLHISDIQAGKFNILEDIKRVEKTKDPEKIYDSIINDLRYIFEKIHSQKPIDIIVITGDLASEGKENDYLELEKSFLTMMEDVFINGSNPIPKNRWLIAPGNHDVHWGLNEKRFNEFIEFCNKNGFHQNFELNNPTGIFDIIPFKDKISDIQIDFLVLNSCLKIFNKETEKNADLNKEYFHQFANRLNTSICKILICHHRLIEIASFNKNHCLEELRESNVILALVGDFHKSQKRIDEICGIKFITAGSLLAKSSERVSGYDIMNREFNLYDIDLEEGTISYSAFMKSQNWEELKRERIILPIGRDTPLHKNDKEIIITKLKNIEDIIHRNHPTEDIIIEHMDSNFYSYMKEQNWKKAINQINNKLENEIENILQIEYRILNIRSFLSFIKNVEPQLDIKVPLVGHDYNISALDLAVSMRRELPSWRISLFNMIKEKIEDLNFLSTKLTFLLSIKGVRLLLTDDQKERVKILTSRVEVYKEENIKRSIGIDIEEDRRFEIEELEKGMINLYNKINPEDFEEIFNFLNEIQNRLEYLNRTLKWD